MEDPGCSLDFNLSQVKTGIQSSKIILGGTVKNFGGEVSLTVTHAFLLSVKANLSDRLFAPATLGNL